MRKAAADELIVNRVTKVSMRRPAHRSPRVWRDDDIDMRNAAADELIVTTWVADEGIDALASS